ncbi:MAG: hypothetical protein E7324_03345 [Clostridiales bacterium]|nr:hypothetical protein [Clostridiales bacterium]
MAEGVFFLKKEYATLPHPKKILLDNTDRRTINGFPSDDEKKAGHQQRRSVNPPLWLGHAMKDTNPWWVCEAISHKKYKQRSLR